MSKKPGRIGANIAVTIAGPALVYLFFFALTRLTGHTNFGVGADLRTIVYNMCYSGCIALAVSYNLTSGRFDFSVGSVLILSLIAGGTLAGEWGAGPFGLLFLVMAFGIVLGTISGLFYVLLRLPSMVTSLGVAMIFEAVAFKLNKSNGVRLIGKFDMLIWAQWPYNVLLVLGLLVVLTYLLVYTRFGYNSMALQTGQKNAVDVGINEKRNALACYAIAGGLMACAGVLYISQYGYIRPETGLGSASFIMSAFLPMFIGSALAKYSNRNIGVMMGAIVQACISSGLVNMGASSSLKTVFDGVTVLLFLIYVSNSYKLGIFRMRKAKKARAIAERAIGEGEEAQEPVFRAAGRKEQGMNQAEFLGTYASWQAAEGIWFITAVNGSMYLYLLEGSERALLIDTGYGFGNIRDYAQQLTDKPVIAVNTHGHLDHSGGNGWWERVYMHRDAAEDLGTLSDGPFDVSTLPYPDYERVPIGEGDVIRLGGRDIEVIEAASHAVSGLFFHDLKSGFLFCGDELESAQVIQLSYTKTVPSLAQRAAEHKRSMQKLVDRLDQISLICPAHNGAPLSRSYIYDYMELDDLIIAGNHTVCERIDHYWIEQRPDAATLRRTRHKKASFIYTAEE